MTILNLFVLMADTFRTFFDALVLPVVDFIDKYAVGGQWLVNLINSSAIASGLLCNVTLAGVLFGITLLGVFVIQIVYFFLP